ncbi:MAG: hypothetical protein K2Q32_03380 [Alphaproteobacteria bacterium]|nr:hypothetical protein [Alphaproteobacteria bacterium]
MSAPIIGFTEYMGKHDKDYSTGMKPQEERLHEIISDICDTQRQPLLTLLAIWNWAANRYLTDKELREIDGLKEHITQLHILTTIKKILEHDTGRDASVYFSIDLETSERQRRGIELLYKLLSLKPEHVPIVLNDVQMVSRMEQDHLDLTGLSVLELLHQSGGSKLWKEFIEPLREDGNADPKEVAKNAARHEAAQKAMRHIVVKLQEASSHLVLGLRARWLLQKIRGSDPDVCEYVDDVLAKHRNNGRLAKKPEGQAPSA